VTQVASTLAGKKTETQKPANFLQGAGWLTVERAAYLAIALAAGWLRFLHLGMSPLDPQEAKQAWAAWRLAQGLEAIGSGLSPLLLASQYLSFLITGATDTMARFWPALAGTGMVLLPYGLRSRLGRGGALAAAALLTLSPSLIFFSRHGSGAILVAAASLALLVGFLNWVDGRQRWLTFAAVAAGAMLISEPSAWTMVPVFLGLGLWLARDCRPRGEQVRQPLAAFGIVVVLGSTALLLHWRGLGLTADLLSAWLGRFRVGSGSYPWFWPALRLLLDEPLLLVLGGGGIVWGLLRRDKLAIGLAAWAGWALLIQMVAGGRQPGDLLVPLVPLALLGGQVLGRLAIDLRDSYLEDRQSEDMEGRLRPGLEFGLLVIVLMVLLATLAIWLASYSRSYSSEYMWVSLSPIGLAVLAVVLYGLWGGWATALRGAATALLLVLILYGVSLAWGLNLDFSVDRRGAILAESGSHGMRMLPATLEILSSQQADDPHEIPLDMVTESENDRLAPVLGWALRDFVHIRWVRDGILGSAAETVVAPESLEVPVGETYAGQDFAMIDRWSPQGLRGKALLRWLLYREAPAAPLADNAVLWVSTGQ
jgi:4-amino-4-deoxy-L-arabinose transferase-like glycosyltransferase